MSITPPAPVLPLPPSATISSVNCPVAPKLMYRLALDETCVTGLGGVDSTVRQTPVPNAVVVVLLAAGVAAGLTAAGLAAAGVAEGFDAAASAALRPEKPRQIARAAAVNLVMIFLPDVENRSQAHRLVVASHGRHTDAIGTLPLFPGEQAFASPPVSVHGIDGSPKKDALMTRNVATLASLSALLAGLMMAPVAQAGEAGHNEDPPRELVGGELYRVVGAAEACGAKAAPATDATALAAAKIAAEVRLARLASELQDLETITLPAELEAHRAVGPIADALRDEELIYNAHREMLASKLAAFAEDKAVKQAELDLNRQKQALFDRQIALAQSQLDRIDTLRDKGLALSSQTIALEQSLLQLEVANDDLKLSILHALQSVNQVDRTVAEMRAQYRNETLAEVNKTQTMLAKLTRQSAASTSLEPRPSADCDASGASLFVVVRASNGALQAIPVAPAGGARPAPQLYAAEAR